MNPDTTQDTAYRALQALWNGTSEKDLGTLYDDRFRFRNVSREHDDTDLSGLRHRIAWLRSCNPAGNLHVNESVQSGNQVVFWWTFGDSGADAFSHSEGGTPSAKVTGTTLLLLDQNRVIEMCEIGGELVSEPC